MVTCSLPFTPLRVPVRRFARGFSLPEVAIAVAIAALGLLTLLGVIPTGLDSIRAAGETTAEARVVSQVVGELQMSDWGNKSADRWTKLDEILTRRWYYDDQANPLDQSSGTSFATRLTYVVRVRRANATALLPGANAAYDDLQSVLIDIAVTPNPAYAFTNPKAFRTRPALLARQFSTNTSF